MESTRRRVFFLGAVALGAIALAASSVEIFHNTAVQVEVSRDWKPQSPPTNAAVAGARSYGELPATRRGPNASWQSHLSDLSEPHPAPEPLQGEARATARAKTLAARAETRAYLGAPPTIPHPVSPRDASGCLGCHGGAGTVLDGRVATPIPHPAYQSCTQCHAPEGPRLIPPSSLEVSNSFTGARSTLLGARAWPGAPPLIPHPTTMRESCISCHGPQGAPGIRTTHPERVSCTQCHAPSAALDLRESAR